MPSIARTLAGMPRRALGAVVGALTADAAATGVHWIYDEALLAALHAEHQSVEFLDPPRAPFYSYEVGRNSP